MRLHRPFVGWRVGMSTSLVVLLQENPGLQGEQGSSEGSSEPGSLGVSELRSRERLVIATLWVSVKRYTFDEHFRKLLGDLTAEHDDLGVKNAGDRPKSTIQHRDGLIDPGVNAWPVGIEPCAQIRDGRNRNSVVIQNLDEELKGRPMGSLIVGEHRADFQCVPVGTCVRLSVDDDSTTEAVIDREIREGVCPFSDTEKALTNGSRRRVVLDVRGDLPEVVPKGSVEIDQTPILQGFGCVELSLTAQEVTGHSQTHTEKIFISCSLIGEHLVDLGPNRVKGVAPSPGSTRDSALADLFRREIGQADGDRICMDRDPKREVATPVEQDLWAGLAWTVGLSLANLQQSLLGQVVHDPEH